MPEASALGEALFDRRAVAVAIAILSLHSLVSHARYAIKRRRRRIALGLFDQSKGADMSAFATLSPRFRITIPKVIRDKQGWTAGQDFVFISKGRGVLVMPIPLIGDLRGIAKGAEPSGYRDRNDRF